MSDCHASTQQLQQAVVVAMILPLKLADRDIKPENLLMDTAARVVTTSATSSEGKGILQDIFAH